MSGPVRVDLAHEQPFAIGRLSVRPATREVVRDDGATEVLEPRVMQVLVALHRARGAVLSRDDLTTSCWDSRVVGEDAINRVISRLRRTTEGIGEGAFRIETVTKVGYRLVIDGSDDHAAVSTAFESPETSTSATRRTLVGAGLGVGALGLAGGGWWWAHRTPPRFATPPADVAALMTQADLALEQSTREGQNQAIGLYQQVVATEPRYADGWGGLSSAYAFAAHYRATPESQALRQRGRASAARALALDPNNARGRVGAADNRPARGNWLGTERALRQALAVDRDATPLLYWLAWTLAAVGRMREASECEEQVATLRGSSTPNLTFNRIIMLWAAGRQEEADQLMAEGARLFPTHFAIWFARCYVQLYSGRPGAALAMTADRANRPSGIPDAEIDRVARVIAAAQSGSETAIDAVMKEQLSVARLAAGQAENAMQFANLLGRLDDAFAIAGAYYFGRGWVVPEVRFSATQGTYTPRGDQLTALLFWPSTAPMRRDPRFTALVRDLGLEDYWRRSGSRPDYQRTA